MTFTAVAGPRTSFFALIRPIIRQFGLPAPGIAPPARDPAGYSPVAVCPRRPGNPPEAGRPLPATAGTRRPGAAILAGTTHRLPGRHGELSYLRRAGPLRPALRDRALRNRHHDRARDDPDLRN